MSNSAWTILVYLDAIEPDPATVLDAIAAASLKEGVRVFAHVGSGKSYVRKELENDRWNDCEPQSGEPSAAAVAEFLSWGAAQEPGARIALILSGHGSGVREVFSARLARKISRAFALGACGSSFLSRLRHRIDHCATLWGPARTWSRPTGQMIAGLGVPELCAALKATGVHTEILGFDACYMSMVEVGYEARGFASLMVASEPESGDGDQESWNYKKFLSDISSDTSAEEIADSIVATYGDPSGENRTIAVLRLGDEMTRVQQAFTALASELMSNYDAQRCAIQAARTKTIDQFSSNAFVDTLALLNNQAAQGVGGDAVALAEAAIEDALGPVRRAGTDGDGLSGLSIFYPLVDDPALGPYSKYAFAQETGWGNFVTRAAEDHRSAVLACTSVMAAAARRFVEGFLLAGRLPPLAALQTGRSRVVVWTYSVMQRSRGFARILARDVV